MNNKYFLITPPGLEVIAKEELFQRGGLTSKIIHGGLEVECDHSTIMNLNASLKIPSRILWRISSFRCRDFPKLFSKIQKIPWNKILVTTLIEIKSSSTNSRIFDSRRIEKSFQAGLQKYFKSNTPPKEIITSDKKQKVYLRVVEDEVTISVDTSGDHLHQRLYRTSIGEAPLRENLAAACAYQFKKYLKKTTTIIDPMCGSGTLLTELALLNHKITTRSFAYPYQTPKKELTCELNLVGRDIDQKSIDASKENAKRTVISIDYKKEDLFFENPWKDGPTAILCNLPYGIRVKTQYSLQALCDQIISKYRPQIIGLLLPKDGKIQFEKYKIVDSLQFQNGGIEVSFQIYINSSSN